MDIGTFKSASTPRSPDRLVLRVDRGTLLRHSRMSEAEQLEITRRPLEFVGNACIAAVTTHISVLMELVKSDDDTVKLALTLNSNFEPGVVSNLLERNPLKGHFMGVYNPSIILLKWSEARKLPVVPIASAVPHYYTDGTFRFDLEEGFSPLTMPPIV